MGLLLMKNPFSRKKPRRRLIRNPDRIEKEHHVKNHHVIRIDLNVTIVREGTLENGTTGSDMSDPILLPTGGSLALLVVRDHGTPGGRKLDVSVDHVLRGKLKITRVHP